MVKQRKSPPKHEAAEADSVRTRPRGKTRERLVEAGCQLFARAGFDGTTIGELELEAGLAPGTGSFYRHFRNKEELLEEVVAHETERLRQLGADRLRLLETSLGNTRADLLLNLKIQLHTLEQVRSFIDILIREEQRFSEERMEAFRERFVEAPLRKDVEEFSSLIESGEIVDGDPAALALVVRNALMGNFLVRRYYGMDSIGGVDEERFSAAIVDLVTGSLQKRAPPD
jgi:AcrR family transcriptional regulator